ncbi:MAG: MFS transporter [Dehalococcoidia bacterium]|nr:MFS transporter [Dehalococcoidia bacterium]
MHPERRTTAIVTVMVSEANWVDERFPAMRSWDYRRLFVNGFFTTGSRWAQVLARGWLVHELSDGSSTAVGLVTFASFLPFIFVGPVAGVMADRIDRRRLLIWATLFGIVSAVALTAIVVADVVEVWHVVVLAFLSGAAQSATVPARQALVANVVPKTQLMNAVALAGISQHGSRVIGPLFGGALLATLGAGSVFGLSAVLLSIGLIEVLRMRYRLADEQGATAANTSDAAPATWSVLEAVGSVRAGLVEAARYVRQDRRLMTIIGLVGMHCSFTMAFDSMMPRLAEEVGGREGLYSAVLVGLGVGAIAGTLVVSQLHAERAKGVSLAVFALGSGLAMIVLGTAVVPAMVVFGAILAGSMQASYMTVSAALIQEIVPDELRGRVMSLYIMIAAGHMAFVNLGFGWAADSINVRYLLVGPGVLWAAIFIVAMASLVEVRSLVRRGRFVSMGPVAVEPVPVAVAAGGGGAAGG